MGNEETPAPSPPEGGVETRNSRETVVKAFTDAYSLMETDLSVDQRIKNSISEAREKTIDQGKSTFTNTFENHHTGETFNQEEGIPVEDILQFLGKKIDGVSPNTPEWQNLINLAHILKRNSAPYNELPYRMEPDRFEGRVHQEAYLISQDQRKTGDQNSDWFKAIDTLNNRRELVLPSLQPNIDEWGESGKPTGEEPILEEPSPDEVPKTETPPFFGFDIVNYEEAISKEAHLEARKSVTEDIRRGKWFKFWHWPRKIGMRLIEPAMVNFRKERLREAMHKNNFSAGQLATLERFKEGRTFVGEKREEVQGNLKGLITEQILKPIIDGQITTPEQVQKLLADFVKTPKNLNDPQVKAIFGSEANDFGDVAEIFATDVLEQGLSLKAYMDAHQKTLQQMDQHIGINLDYARLGHMTDTRNYVDRAVAWAKRRQSENLARGARGLGFSGVILNPAVVGVASALAVSGLMRSAGWGGRLAALPSFFIGGLAGGGVAGMRRYYELGWDRSQHAAERVSGAAEPGTDDKRRGELEKRRYNIASVDQLLNINGLLTALSKDANQTNQEAVASRMMEIRQRLDMSSLLKKDLIDYQSAQGKQIGANELTKAIVMLRAALQNSGADIQGLETRFKTEWSKAFTDNINEQDRSFQSYRLKEAGKAAFFGSVAGMAAGAVGSEVLVRTGRALGVIDWQAPSEWIRSFFEAPRPPVVPPSVPDINTLRSMFPGINAAVDGSGNINVTGAIPPDAQVEMQRLGFTVNQGPDIAGALHQTIEQRPVSGPNGEWLKNSLNIDHREWYSYNQSGSQLNELRLYTFKEGDTVVLDMSKMLEGFERGVNPEHINVQEVIRNGEAGVFISRPDDPQNGFWVMDKDDGVIDGHIRLDPNAAGKTGEIARMVLNQTVLQKLADGNIATELRGHQDVFNIGADGKPGFIEAGRIVERNGVNVLQDFATIRGTSLIPETVGMPITVPGEPTPTFEIVPPPVPEVVPETEETSFIIPIPFAPRHPLEPLENPPGIIYYGYNEPVSEERKIMFERNRSQTLKENPDAVLDPYQEVKNYFTRQDPNYMKEVRELAGQITVPASANLRAIVCIPVAGHEEGEHIYETLENYRYQKALNDQYEILLFVNHPEGTRLDKTMDEINRFKNEHPDLPVRVIYKQIPRDKAKMAIIRKYLNDVALLRNHKEGGKDVILISNDADLRGVSPDYIDNFINRFDQSSNIDGMVGQLDWDPQSYVEYPAIHAGTRLFQYLNLQIWGRKHGDRTSSGANFAFKGSIYAGVGGYQINDMPGAEDVILGQAIRASRNSSKTLTYAGARVSRLYTSSRRAIDAWNNGFAPIQQWDRNWGPINGQIRRMKLGEHTFVNYDDPVVQTQLKTDLEKVVDRTLNYYGDESKNLENEIFKRAVGWLGISYKINNQGRVEITDMKRFIEGVKRYQQIGLTLQQIKSGKLPTTASSPAGQPAPSASPTTPSTPLPTAVPPPIATVESAPPSLNLIDRVNSELRGAPSVLGATTIDISPQELIGYIRSLPLPAGTTIQEINAQIINGQLSTSGKISSRGLDATFEATFSNDPQGNLQMVTHKINLPFAARFIPGINKQIEQRLATLNSSVATQVNSQIDPAWETTGFKVEGGHLNLKLRKKSAVNAAEQPTAQLPHVVQPDLDAAIAPPVPREKPQQQHERIINNIMRLHSMTREQAEGIYMLRGSRKAA